MIEVRQATFSKRKLIAFNKQAGCCSNLPVCVFTENLQSARVWGCKRANWCFSGQRVVDNGMNFRGTGELVSSHMDFDEQQVKERQ
jgi:hypothetical protein